jgi:hypothetical protein
MKQCTVPPSWPVADCRKIRSRVEWKKSWVRLKSSNVESI